MSLPKLTHEFHGAAPDSLLSKSVLATEMNLLQVKLGYVKVEPVMWVWDYETKCAKMLPHPGF